MQVIWGNPTLFQSAKSIEKNVEKRWIVTYQVIKNFLIHPLTTNNAIYRDSLFLKAFLNYFWWLVSYEDPLKITNYESLLYWIHCTGHYFFIFFNMIFLISLNLVMTPRDFVINSWAQLLLQVQKFDWWNYNHV